MEYNDLFDLSNLISKYFKDELSPEEKTRLDSWLQASHQNRAQFDRLTAEAKLKTDYADYGQSDKKVAWKRIAKATGYQAKPKKRAGSFYRALAAASILLFLSVGAYFYFKPSAQLQADAQQHDILPGHNQAILTLASGKQIILTKQLTGQLAQQKNAIILVKAGNSITYTSTNPSNSNSQIEYNTLSTKTGEQSPFPLVLADGTKVWLNASSTVKFPTTFTQNTREVTITGEAYFEVAHNRAKPFRVNSNGQTIEVLGTRFNVNNYPNEHNTKTTLLEGSVKIITANKTNTKTIKPGQQAIVTGGVIDTKEVDTDEITAWKEGYFEFTNMDIQTIARQLARWYDVDFTYEGPITTETFTGRISKNRNISQVLKILQASKSVNPTIQGRRIMIKQ